jgi:hypothetical protein
MFSHMLLWWWWLLLWRDFSVCSVAAAMLLFVPSSARPHKAHPSVLVGEKKRNTVEDEQEHEDD